MWEPGFEWVLPVHKAAPRASPLAWGEVGTPHQDRDARTSPAMGSSGSTAALGCFQGQEGPCLGAQVLLVQVWRGCRASRRALGTGISVLGKVFILE